MNNRQTNPNYSGQLRWVDQVSQLMDNKFRVPGTDFRFGLDPLLNFIPGLGALSGFAISGALLLTMSRYGASGRVLVLMIINIVLDTLIGSIPVLGWIFDFAYKSNVRNVKLLREHYTEGKHHGSGKGLVTAIILVLVALTILMVYVIWQLIEWFAGLF